MLADIAGAWAEDRTGFIGALHAPDVIETTRAEFETAKRLGAVALPTVLLDLGEGPKLVSGGYASAEFLLQDLQYWLQPG